MSWKALKKGEWTILQEGDAIGATYDMALSIFIRFTGLGSLRFVTFGSEALRIGGSIRTPCDKYRRESSRQAGRRGQPS